MKKLRMALLATIVLGAFGVFAGTIAAGCGEQLVEFPIDFSIPPDMASDLSDGGADLAPSVD